MLSAFQGLLGSSLLWAIPPVRLGLSGRNSGKIPERPRKRSQSISWNFPSRVRLGCPKPYNSRHLRLPERFQNSLPPSTAGDASFFRIGSGEGLSELVMEFPAVLGVFLILSGCFIDARHHFSGPGPRRYKLHAATLGQSASALREVCTGWHVWL